MGVDLAWRLKRRLVGADEPGDRKPGLAAARKKLGPRAKRMRQAGVGRGGVLAGAVADDEAAADRKPGLVGERGLPAASRAISRRVFGWRGAGVTVSKTIAVAGSKAIERRPASLRRFVARTSAARASAASGSTLSGR